jgi:hypothetical protein
VGTRSGGTEPLAPARLLLDLVAAARVVLPADAGGGTVRLVGRHDLDHLRETLETLGRIDAEVDEHVVGIGLARVLHQADARTAHPGRHGLAGTQAQMRQELEVVESPERTIEVRQRRRRAGQHHACTQPRRLAHEAAGVGRAVRHVEMEADLCHWSLSADERAGRFHLTPPAPARSE